MRTLTDYDYLLPEALIAQFPPKIRGASRLLIADNRADKPIIDAQFESLIDHIKPNDLLVINNTRVLPARIFAQKETGGAVELLVERLLSNTQFLAQARASKAPKENQLISINGQPVFRMVERKDAFFIFETLNNETVLPLLEKHGHMPLPPYIQRADEESDEERYQTVFSKEKGAVAAPTAGLHFTTEFIEQLKNKGASFAEVTLHVGAGTFKPVREAALEKHIMHEEWIDVPEQTVAQILATKKQGGRIISVGTTVARALETAALSGTLQLFTGDTNIFIKEGFEFKVIDGLITNFHLPKSTLLILVSTFMGYERIKELYNHAIKERYRFFSYGDAMLLIP